MHTKQIPNRRAERPILSKGSAHSRRETTGVPTNTQRCSGLPWLGTFGALPLSSHSVSGDVPDGSTFWSGAHCNKYYYHAILCNAMHPMPSPPQEQWGEVAAMVKSQQW